MRRLVQTMLKYDKETSFGQQASLMQSTKYAPDQDFVAVRTGGFESSRTLALASSIASALRPKKKRNKSKCAQSEYMPTATNLSVAYGIEREDGEQYYLDVYEERELTPFKHGGASPSRSMILN